MNLFRNHWLLFCLMFFQATSVWCQTDSLGTASTPSATLKNLDKQFKQLQSTNKNAQALEVLQRYGQLYASQKQAERQQEIAKLDQQFRQSSAARQKQLTEIRSKSAGLQRNIDTLESSKASLHSSLFVFFGLLIGIIVVLISIRNRKLRVLKAQLESTGTAKQLVSGFVESANSRKDSIAKSVQTSYALHNQLGMETQVLKELSEDKNHPAHRQVRNLLQSMNQAVRVSVSSFLTAASDEKEKLNLNELLNDVSVLAAENFRRDQPEFEFELTRDLEGILPETEIYRGDLRDTLFCLITNAIRSVHQKSGNAPKGYKPRITLSTRKLPRYIQIRIRDNGSGPGASFNPETEDVNELISSGDDGLGIIMAREVIRSKHKGELVFETEPGSQNDTIIRFQTLALQ